MPHHVTFTIDSHGDLHNALADIERHGSTDELTDQDGNAKYIYRNCSLGRSEDGTDRIVLHAELDSLPDHLNPDVTVEMMMAKNLGTADENKTAYLGHKWRHSRADADHLARAFDDNPEILEACQEYGVLIDHATPRNELDDHRESINAMIEKRYGKKRA
ncbi:MAG: hypothetical protein F4Y26_05280 [Gammaproteobacteria bacterium]|nr:hypothetical protein [Gammaproteobacteria bacterium]